MNEERNVEGDVYKSICLLFDDYTLCIDKQVYPYCKQRVDRKIFRMADSDGRNSVEYSVLENVRRNIYNSYSK